MELVEATTLERIELIAKFVCFGRSSDREKQVALLWIAELVEDVRNNRSVDGKKPPL
ncbi:hypothetical protein NMD70_15590 [Edwardsiella tarda]|uniref:Uncharacterized protein n=1 Tax=Edwardsiella tarda TaxID=636 RepID=A0A2A7U715_EDWTA|nr:hypothetical protein [Edwardsiella tarda]ATI63804.1 hypothetical protein CPU03_05720 [Edwardsiella tarda]PEH74155.1 hypothetical protein CRM76_01730 [Edwardsiella tarda]BEH73726.1 hypothetical protein GBS0709_28430 [Edwardsiella tarda]